MVDRTMPCASLLKECYKQLCIGAWQEQQQWHSTTVQHAWLADKGEIAWRAVHTLTLSSFAFSISW